MFQPTVHFLADVVSLQFRGSGNLWEFGIQQHQGSRRLQHGRCVVAHVSRSGEENAGEAFNLPNHANFNTPVATLNSGTFGQIQAAADPRIVQLAMKLVF